MQWSLLLLIGLIILALFTGRPITHADESNTVAVSGRLVRIAEGSADDVVIQLADDPGHYYINQGLKQGLRPDYLHQALVGQNVELRYVRHWSVLNAKGLVRHVAYLARGELVVYSEME